MSSGRLVGLGLLAACEVVAGIGVRNEAMAARARAEIQRRRIQITESRLAEHHAFLAAHVAPDQVVLRLTERAELAVRRVPEL